MAITVASLEHSETVNMGLRGSNTTFSSSSWRFPPSMKETKKFDALLVPLEQIKRMSNE